MDSGAWRAAVQRAAKSQTRLSDQAHTYTDARLRIFHIHYSNKSSQRPCDVSCFSTLFVLFLYLITRSPAPFSSHHATNHTLGSMCSRAETQIHTMGSMTAPVLLLMVLSPLAASPLTEQQAWRSRTNLLLLQNTQNILNKKAMRSLKGRQTATVWLSCVQNMGRKELPRITKLGPPIVSALLYPLRICIKIRE